MNYLHETTHQLQKELKTFNDSEQSNINQHNESFGIRPRSLSSLHLTFFFGGEVLSALPAKELIDWHAAIQSRLAQDGFYLRDANDPEQTSPPHHDDVQEPTNPDQEELYWLRVAKFRLFPPRRNYLVVAELEASPALHELYRDLHDIARMSSCDALVEIAQNNPKIWIPHVTLANIQSRKESANRETTRQNLQRLQVLLDDIPSHNAKDGSSSIIILPASVGM
eukprot:CAMPEP_0172452752 /NCGR_PEP_ID=MMETSP1065-20121228/10317_1 /TAXON_ID=265537 /ORGANISM="Amphiprora paludosa, Strain CCMP125" /LENGTH=223 /DNA_ID=CAMNT_0013204857 /DNA_START=85 /DNA_END=753 /DNA_ORIENTATION=+